LSDDHDSIGRPIAPLRAAGTSQVTAVELYNDWADVDGRGEMPPSK